MNESVHAKSVHAGSRRAWLLDSVRGSGLWSATMLDKLAMAAFTFRVAHVTEVQGLGVMSTVLAAAWMVGTIGGLGLVDAAVFRAARTRGDPQFAAMPKDLGQLHGRFVFLVGMSCFCLGLVAGWVGGDERFSAFARWLVAGAALRSIGAFGLGSTRGWSQARWETLAVTVSAVALAGTAWWASTTTALGIGWCIAGALQLAVAASACLAHPNLRPRWGPSPTFAALFAIGTPYLALGLGSWLLGNLDIICLRTTDSPSNVGILVAATAPTRAAALLPWLCATLWLHRQHQRWQKGQSTPVGAVIIVSSGLAVVIGAIVWAARPLLGLAFNVDTTQIETPLAWSLCAAPLWYAAQFLIPIGAAFQPRGLLIRLFAALTPGALASFFLATHYGPTGAIAGLAIGHGLAAVFLAVWMHGVPRGTSQSASSRSP